MILFIQPLQGFLSVLTTTKIFEMLNRAEVIFVSGLSTERQFIFQKIVKKGVVKCFILPGTLNY